MAGMAEGWRGPSATCTSGLLPAPGEPYGLRHCGWHHLGSRRSPSSVARGLGPGPRWADRNADAAPGCAARAPPGKCTSWEARQARPGRLGASPSQGSGCAVTEEFRAAQQHSVEYSFQRANVNYVTLASRQSLRLPKAGPAGGRSAPGTNRQQPLQVRITSRLHPYACLGLVTTVPARQDRGQTFRAPSGSQSSLSGRLFRG